MIDKLAFFQKYHNDLNKIFCTRLQFDINDVSSINAFSTCFKLFDSFEDMQENMHWSEEDIQDYFDCGTIYDIDGVFVVFDELYYDWDNHRAISKDDFIEEELE